jgi:hypothetical protein
MTEANENLFFSNPRYCIATAGVCLLTLAALHAFLCNSSDGGNVDSASASGQKQKHLSSKATNKTKDQKQVPAKVKAAAAAAAAASPSDWRLLGVLWLLYLGLLSPTLGVVGGEHIQVMSADRYSYIPHTMVLSPALALGIQRGWSLLLSCLAPKSDHRAGSSKAGSAREGNGNGRKSSVAIGALGLILSAVVGTSTMLTFAQVSGLQVQSAASADSVLEPYIA